MLTSIQLLGISISDCIKVPVLRFGDDHLISLPLYFDGGKSEINLFFYTLIMKDTIKQSALMSRYIINK